MQNRRQGSDYLERGQVNNIFQKECHRVFLSLFEALENDPAPVAAKIFALQVHLHGYSMDAARAAFKVNTFTINRDLTNEE